ncbi:MAG: hypothetical protein V1758_00430 [Pseudomonadota bacterium]
MFFGRWCCNLHGPHRDYAGMVPAAAPAKSDYQPKGSLCDRRAEFDYRTCWEGAGAIRGGSLHVGFPRHLRHA